MSTWKTKIKAGSTEQYGIDSAEKFGKAEGDETLCKLREEETLGRGIIGNRSRVVTPRSAYLQTVVLPMSPYAQKGTITAAPKRSEQDHGCGPRLRGHHGPRVL